MEEVIKEYKKYTKQRNVIENKKKLGLYLNPHIPLSYHNISNFVYTAVRGIGKSVIAVEDAIILKRKYGYDNVKCFYFRATDLSIKNMLKNHAAKAVDPYLIRKYDLEITCKNNIVYDHGKPLIEFYPLVSAISIAKGGNFYDENFLNNRPLDPRNGKPIKRFIVTIWDEFLVDDDIGKRPVGDQVEQYNIYMEAIFRDQKRIKEYNAVYNFFLANNVSECANVTGRLFNYIPDPNKHSIVKLTRKHCIFWNVPVTKAYIEKRKESYNADILNYADDPNYANIKRDLSMIKDKKQRLNKVTKLIKFSKRSTDWYCVYDNKFIREYKNESVKDCNTFAMIRHIDGAIYDQQFIKDTFDRYDAHGFYYADLISMASFQSKMKQLKSK